MIVKATSTVRQLLRADNKWEWVMNELAVRRFRRRMRREIVRNTEFDRTHGTDTADEINLEQAGLSALQARRGNTLYRVFWEDSFKAVFDDLPIDHAEFTFVDIGAGKGKLLLLASHYPLRKIIGIELARLLHQIAQRNIEVYRSPLQRCRDVSSVLADALEYELPRDPLVCLMVNPFDPPTIARVLDRLAAHARLDGKPMFVVYANMRRIAEAGAVFDGLDGLRVLVRRRNHIILGNDAAARLCPAR